MSDRFVEVGKKAPQFTLKNQNGEDVSLSDYEGQYVVLYFYPRALTPGCTTQACAIRDYAKEFKKSNTVVLGLSPDNVDLVKKFDTKYDLNFDLLADEGHKVAEKYGAWGEKMSFGKRIQGITRMTYIIGKDAKVLHVMPKVNTKTHHEDVLNVIKEAS